MQSVITAKGRISIPKEIRDHLGLKAKGRVKFSIRPDGSVVLLPAPSISAVRSGSSLKRRKFDLQPVWAAQSA